MQIDSHAYVYIYIFIYSKYNKNKSTNPNSSNNILTPTFPYSFLHASSNIYKLLNFDP